MTQAQSNTLAQVQAGYDYTEYVAMSTHPRLVVDCYLRSDDRLKYQTTITIDPDGARHPGAVS